MEQRFLCVEQKLAVSASAVAAYANGLTDNEVTVHLLGGDLHISIDEHWHVRMTGGATIVFDGEVEICW